MSLLDKNTSSIIAGPDIITRGFIYAKEAEGMINEVKTIAREEIERALGNNVTEWYLLKQGVKTAVEKYLFEETKRRPTIFPIIVEV